MTVFETFLNVNGYEFTMTNDEAEDYTVYLAYDEKFKENDCIHYLVNELKDYIHPPLLND
nr:hypothetical protein [Gracilibacillus boraciitolerans]